MQHNLQAVLAILVSRLRLEEVEFYKDLEEVKFYKDLKEVEFYKDFKEVEFYKDLEEVDFYKDLEESSRIKTGRVPNLTEPGHLTESYNSTRHTQENKEPNTTQGRQQMHKSKVENFICNDN